MRKYNLTLVSCLLSAVLLSAQPPHSFTRYGRENNFSGTTVEDLAQDRFGQLWLATWGGLYSFDGRTFQNYRTDMPGDRDNPQSNHFTDVEILDDGGILVVSFDNHLYRLNPTTRVLDPVDTGGQGVQEMLRPAPDSLYFLSTSGEVLNADFSPYCRVKNGATVRAMLNGPDGQDWILTDLGIYRGGILTSQIPTFCGTTVDGQRYIGSAGEMLRYSDAQLTSLPTQTDADITLIAQVPGRPELLLGTDHDGFELYNLDNGSRLPIRAEGDRFGEGPFSSLADRLGHLWIYSQQGGLYWYDPQAHRLLPFQNTTLQQGWNAEAGVTALLSDLQGNLWIASGWGGLERVIFHRENFKLKSLDESRQVTPENSVRALTQDESGWIYATTRDSRLHVLDETLRERAAWSLERPGYTLIRAHDGNLWVGTRGAGLLEMTVQSNERLRYSQIRHDRDDLFYGPNSRDIFSLLEDGNHRLWIGTFDDGIAYVDLDGKDRLFISKKNRLSFPTDRRNRIRCLALGPDGRLYAGGQMGLFVCDHPEGEPEDMHFERFTQILDYDIQHILFTRQGDLYASSFGAGLLRFDSGDPDSGFHAWTVNDGMLSNYILSAIEDESGNLWIATQAGLNRLNPQTGSLIGYPYDRLGHTLRFNEGQPLQALDGNICFNTSAGIFYFNPEEISNSDFVPQLVIQAFYVSGERRNEDGKAPVFIRPTDGIRVQVAAVDLTTPEQVIYSYKLDGADKDWIHLGHQASISIPPQRPGRYTLRIRSTNGAGLEVDNEKDFLIVVRRKFLQSGWMALLYLLAAGGAVWLMTRRRLQPGSGTPPDTEEDPQLHGLHGEDRRFVESLIAFLTSRLDDGALEVQQICEAMGVSRSVLFERCRVLLGTTPAAFLRRLRMERAQTLLREGGHSMAEISYAIGFNDPHYFSKVFKKETGMTPTEFRSRKRATAASQPEERETQPQA